MVFCLVLVILLFCITKFYTETLLDIIYVCWFRMKHRNGTEPHHTISMYANYLHKRELRFTIISVHRIHSISTLHGDDPLSCVQSWNTTTQSNEKYYSNTRQKKQAAAKHCSNGKIHKTVFNTISSFGVFFHETANGKIMPTNMPICDCSSAFQRNSHICKRRNILFYFIFERNLTQKKQHEARDFISKFTCDFTDLLFIAWQIWTHNHWILSLEKWRNSFHFNFVLLSHYWNKSFFTRFYEVHITNGIWKGMPIIE